MLSIQGILFLVEDSCISVLSSGLRLFFSLPALSLSVEWTFPTGFHQRSKSF